MTLGVLAEVGEVPYMRRLFGTNAFKIHTSMQTSGKYSLHYMQSLLLSSCFQH